MRGFSLALLAALLIPLAADAQFIPRARSSEGVILVSVSPESPGPDSPVALTAASSFIDLSRSDITWVADGRVIARGLGATAAQVRTGALGSTVNVSVTASSPSGESASGLARIRATQLDLLWEADSYVPPFFRGRPLPSSGSRIRVQALLRGTSESPQNLRYIWKKNGAIVPGASGQGRSSAVFPAPIVRGVDTIAVEVLTRSGAFEASGQIAVRSQDPELALYEVHPVFGLEVRRGLASGATVSSEEASFAAVPYFAPVASRMESGLRYSWSVNGRRVPAAESGNSEITINAENSSGLADISLLLTHASNLLLSSRGEWTISLRGSASAESEDPFRVPQ